MNEEPPRQELYSASRIKPRKRRTGAEMIELFKAVREVIKSWKNVRNSIRHLCYRLEMMGVIAKTESAFDTLAGHLAKWRKKRLIPFGVFVDATRWYHGTPTFDDAAAYLEHSIAIFRKNLWRTQPYHVEVWVEKEAVASIVVPVADHWGIKTFVCRGFTSLTSTWEASEIFKEAIRHGKKPIIFYLGDLDLKGKQCGDTIRNHFALHGLDGEVEFRLVAVLPEHIERFNLPTRPPKFKGDPAQCVEIDTLSAAQIRELLEAEITALIVDQGEWNRLQKIEAAEHETLQNILILHQDDLREASA
jgi:hypothetical protein